ncbi:hypothetical protein HY486_00805 [Candidatus Woesearchaeota archaeon]|nr:hypothetical protein [Candidatus Woesearchaeota archaeon]
MGNPEVVVYFKNGVDVRSAVRSLQSMASAKMHSIQVKEEHDGKCSKYVVISAAPEYYMQVFGLQLSWAGA